MAEKKKNALQVKKPTTGDYLSTLSDMFFVNPRNSAAATLGGAAYDYVMKSTPQKVKGDIVRAGDDAYKWLVKKDKALRAAPVTEALRLLKSGYIDPLADPLRVFQQAATERSRGNEAGGKKLAAMVPLSVAGVINPELRGAGKLAAKAGVEAAEKTAVKAATKATPPLKVTPKAKPPSLLSAVRVGGKTYTGPTHLDALDAIPDPKARSQATLDANSRGFVNERGKYLDRFKAADYARNFDLFSPDAPDWAKTAPEVISENLRLPELAVKAETPPAKAPRKEKYQAVEPVANPNPELADIQFPQGAGLGGAFAIANRVPIVGRRPFMAQSNKGYSGLSGSVPANRVTTEVRNVVDLPPEFVTSPEEMAKKFGSGIPLIGDKLIAGTATSRVNDRPQIGETLAMGGPDFARYAEGLGGLEAWKSSPAVIRALENMQRSGEDRFGKPVAGVYTTMGATGLDQSTAMMDLLGRQLAAGGVTKDNLSNFDVDVRKILGEEAAKDFTGFAVDPMAAAAQLNDISKVKMPQRTAVQKLLDKASALDQGFPDIGSNRVALTVPELLYAPEGTSGRAITGLSPSGASINRNAVPVEHPNYPKELKGSYEGRTEFGLPRELMFRDYFKAMETLADKGYTPVQIQAYLFQRTPKEVKDAFGSDPRVQAFDQQWVDETSKYIEDIRKYGEEPYAEGGLAVRRRPTPLSVRRSPRPRKSRKA
jgi:hypothetical protein